MAGAARLPRLQSWVRSAPLGRGRWMTTLGGFLAVQTLSLLLVAEAQGRTSDPDSVLVLAGFTAALAGLALCGAGLPLLAHARRVRKWRQRYLLQLQDARAWFVQGRLDESDLDVVRGPLEEAAAGRFDGEVRRTSGDVLRRTGLFVAAWCVGAAAAALRLDPGPARVALAGLAALAAAAAVALLVLGWPLWRQGKAATTAHLERLEAQEAGLLRKARSGDLKSAHSRDLEPETR